MYTEVVVYVVVDHSVVPDTTVVGTHFVVVYVLVPMDIAVVVLVTVVFSVRVDTSVVVVVVGCTQGQFKLKFTQ